MIQQLEKLTPADRELLLKAPVLVSVFAASRDHEISEKGKADATRLAHLKTFTAVPMLVGYYQEVEKTFDRNFEQTVNKYAPFDDQKRKELTVEIDKAKAVIAKLDSAYADLLTSSLCQYAAHVTHADRELLESFLFPFKIPGLTD